MCGVNVGGLFSGTSRESIGPIKSMDCAESSDSIETLESMQSIELIEFIEL